VQSSGGKPGRKRPPGRPRHRWEDNNKMLKHLVGQAWTGLIWLRTETSDEVE
jgi:hypothetical protein